ncbi:DUF2905 domain-containing protein [Candidatus Nitrospira bockiana]
MPEWGHLGKALTLLGIVLILLGALFTLLSKSPTLPGGLDWLGRLPGDVSIKRDNFTFYFPLATSLVISVVLSIVLYVLSAFLRR